MEVTLVVIVNGSFTDVPNNRSSQNYTAFADKFKASVGILIAKIFNKTINIHIYK